MMNNQTVVSQKTKNKVLWRYMLNTADSLNYEKMGGLSYCYSMYPALKEIYGDRPEAFKKSLMAHSQYYGCNMILSPYIIGINLAIEEIEKEEALDSIATIKTSLMGPLSGIGDTLFMSVPNTIFGAIAAYMALEGNFFGLVLWMCVTFAIKFSSILFFKAGYKSGTNIIESVKEKMQLITKSVSVIGLMVVGGLIATSIRANVAWNYSIGDAKFNGQELIDSIMPALIPALLTGLVYYLLGRKKMTPVKIILVVIFISIIAYVLGILK